MCKKQQTEYLLITDKTAALCFVLPDLLWNFHSCNHIFLSDFIPLSPHFPGFLYTLSLFSLFLFLDKA